MGKFLSLDPLATQYPWNSPYAYAENDVISSIDLDGLEKYLLTTDKGEDPKTGEETTSRHLFLNPHKDQWDKGLIGHYDANNHLTILKGNDLDKLSDFDRSVYDYAINAMNEKNITGGSMRMSANTDIGLRKIVANIPPPTTAVGVRRGTAIIVEEQVSTNTPQSSLDIKFNVSQDKGDNGDKYKDVTKANSSIGKFSNFLISNGIKRINLEISTNYSDDYQNDEDFGTAGNLLKARAATVVKSFSQFGIGVDHIQFSYKVEPSVYASATSAIRVVTGWNVTRIPVQQKLLNGRPAGGVTPAGAGKTTFVSNNSGQSPPKAGTTWH